MSDPYPAGSRSPLPVAGTIQPPGPVVVPHPGDAAAPRPAWAPVVREVAGIGCIIVAYLLAAVSIFFMAGLPATGLFAAAGLVALGTFLVYPPSPPV